MEKGQVSHAVGSLCPLAEAVEVFQRALVNFGSRFLECLLSFV